MTRQNTLYLQRVLGYSPLEAGLVFLPFTAGIIIGAGLSQALVPKVGARELPLIGMTMAIAGMLLFMRLQPGGEYVTDFLPGIMLASIGMGLVFVPVTLIATSGIPDSDAGLASGLYNTSLSRCRFVRARRYERRDRQRGWKAAVTLQFSGAS